MAIRYFLKIPLSNLQPPTEQKVGQFLFHEKENATDTGQQLFDRKVESILTEVKTLHQIPLWCLDQEDVVELTTVGVETYSTEPVDLIGPEITADVHSDDHKMNVQFDARLWFMQADDKDIIDLAQCGWGGDYPADAVATFMAGQQDDVQAVFDYIVAVKTQINGDTMGFECHVDGAQAMNWIRQQRPSLILQIEAIYEE